MCLKRAKFKLEENYLKYQENERIRNKISRKVEWKVFREAGLCGKCGNECIINPRNGRKYSHCELCRVLVNNRSKRNWRKKHPIVMKVKIS